jgi:hypothetical protein
MSSPTKLTPSLSKKTLALAAKGHHIKTICQACAIHRDTYYEWLRRASENEEPFKAWADAISRERAEYLTRTYEEFEKMARKQKSLTAFQWMMERGWPALFGSRLRIDSAEIDESIHRELARQSAGRLGGMATRGASGVLSEASGDAVDLKIVELASSVTTTKQEDWESLPPEFSPSLRVSQEPSAVSTSSGRTRVRQDDSRKHGGSQKNQSRTKRGRHKSGQ